MVNDVSNNPTISVVIPIYNASDVLEVTLRSLQNQSFADFEVLCVDDGSTDRSAEVVSAFAVHDERFKLLKKENGGAASARNLGLEEAAGRYLIFLDSDDYFMPDMLRTMVKALEQDNADICVCETDTFFGDMDSSRPFFRFPSEVIEGTHLRSDLDPILYRCFYSRAPYNKMFRKEFVLQHGLRFQNLPNCNDAYFVICGIALSKKIAVVKQALVYYRQGRGTSLQDGKARYPLCSMQVANEVLANDEVRRNLTHEGDLSLRGECWSLAIHAVEMSIYGGRLQTEAYRQAMSLARDEDLQSLSISHFKRWKDWYKYQAFLRSGLEGLEWAYDMKRNRRGANNALSQATLAMRLFYASTIGKGRTVPK